MTIAQSFSITKLIKHLKTALWGLYIFLMIRCSPLRYKILIRKVKKRNKIKIVFIVQLASSWKYDDVFKSLLKNDRFIPVIAVCPLIEYDNDTMFNEIERAVAFFRQKEYPVLNSWDNQNHCWKDIKKETEPDIVFFTNPWADLSRPEYYIFNFMDALTCYAPYGFKSSHLYEDIFDKDFQNLLWRIFYETQIHKELAVKYARNKGVNGMVTGYPGMDNLLLESYIPQDIWKLKDKSVKRIIWAPHHTIFGKEDSKVGFSTFLKYSNFMFDISRQFKSSIQIAFKPHPLLKTKLYKHPDWGKEKTDVYFMKWATFDNTQIIEGNYIDLFLTSDALINDGESFMVEYLYTRKPAMFLVADDTVTERFNEFGKLTFEHLYHGFCENDIIGFIEEIILDENDYMGKDRLEFFENFVKPPNNKLASENISNFLETCFS